MMPMIMRVISNPESKMSTQRTEGTAELWERWRHVPPAGGEDVFLKV
jgi:hypothetical protein